MDYDALLAEARRAGLDLRLDGDALLVEGPPSAAPLVARLRQAKAGVVVALKAERGDPVGPPWPCAICKTQNWQVVSGRQVVCGTCHSGQELRRCEQCGGPTAAGRPVCIHCLAGTTPRAPDGDDVLPWEPRRRIA
jgi:hypothetical protein